VPEVANVTERPATDWNAINWREANRRVRNLRMRIFRASRQGDLKKVRSLQKLMLRSYSNTLLSVRRVAQVNEGKRTPGVDKLVIKTPERRAWLVDHLMTFQPWRVRPTRRVYIPKASGKLRPLGIPTIRDRAIQARVKNALEPFWEARFEGCSYGFRPGRGCHDAMECVYNLSRPNKRKKWVVDADIQGAFDNIDHEYLLKAVGNFPAREMIRQWLKAGYVDRNVFHETERGTPQGGVVSPLLANIALHGMKEALGVVRVKRGDGQGEVRGPRALVRYADDFVVFCESEEDAARVRDELLPAYLAERGLTLSAEKTRIVHLTEGFDFLGFNVRLYECPKTTKTGYKLLIKPSGESVKEIREKLKAEWIRAIGRRLSGRDATIYRINSIVRGWANYFRVSVAKETFAKLDCWMWNRECRYANQTHPKKHSKWKRKKYFGKMNSKSNDIWVFGDKQTGAYVLKFAWFPIERHVMVKGTSSPDDPDLREYWDRRIKAKAKGLRPSDQKVASNQDYKCPLCGEDLFNGERIEKNRVIPGKEGGTYSYANMQWVHYLCHKQIHGKKPKEKSRAT
jgi:RNA-directed DNA polymerase